MYEPIAMPVAGLTAVRVLMTICAFEFFGPCIRDSNKSHLTNPDWTGHARFHLMWQLGIMFFAGLITLALIWLPDPLRPIHLYVASAILATNLLGFWAAAFLVRLYDGRIFVPGVHQRILGFDENVFVFSILSAIFVIGLSVLTFVVQPQLASQVQTALIP